MAAFLGRWAGLLEGTLGLVSRLLVGLVTASFRVLGWPGAGFFLALFEDRRVSERFSWREDICGGKASRRHAGLGVWYLGGPDPYSFRVPGWPAASFFASLFSDRRAFERPSSGQPFLDGGLLEGALDLVSELLVGEIVNRFVDARQVVNSGDAVLHKDVNMK